MKNIKIAKAGNSGPKVRSDCFIQLEILPTGGIHLGLKSKVERLYGESIKLLVYQVLDFFEIKNAKIELIDKGALPWVIVARIEAAIKQLVSTEKEFLPDFIEENQYPSQKERFRYSNLYLPGNTPSMFLNAGLHEPDGIILDLEEAVPPNKKNEARILVRNALRACNFYRTERIVRINQDQCGIDDLKAIIPHNVHVVLIPRIEDAQYIKRVTEIVGEIMKNHNLTQPVYIMPIIESAMGVEMAFEITKASSDMVAMVFGLENYTDDLGVSSTRTGNETLYARTRLVNACRAAKIQLIDSVFTDVGDTEGLMLKVKMSKSLGFEGLGCIHPRQIPIIKAGFAPEQEEIEKAKKLVFAAQKAEEQGLDEVVLGTKIIDPHVVKHHQKIIERAIKQGLINDGWQASMLIED